MLEDNKFRIDSYLFFRRGELIREVFYNVKVNM